MKNRKEKIITFLTIGVLVIIGITTIVSSFFLNQKKTINSKAAEQNGGGKVIPGVQTPIPINLIGNGSFETGNADGWKFGNLNRAVPQGGAESGSYFLDTSNCASCQSEFGNDKTIVYDVTGNFTAGQKYSASVYFRSPQGGGVRLVLWELGNTSEVLGVSDKVGSADWQKMEINEVAIKNGGNETLRLQIYINNVANNVHYSFDNFVLSQMGTSGSCPTSYYTYQQAVNTDSPTLADLFDGKAHFQNLQESQTLSLQFDSSVIDTGYANGQPSKLPLLYNPEDGKYYAYSRAFGKNPGADGNKHFNMYLMSSTDGITFVQVAPIFDQSVINEMGDMYDGQIAIDYSVCPTKYVMALECSGQMCTSSSTTPFIPSSWSTPKVIVHFILDSKNGHSTNKESASTGVFLIDGTNKYVAWTVLAGGPIDASWGINPSDGVFKKLRDMGTESTYSRAVVTSDFPTDLGSSNIGSIVLPADTNTHCSSAWDCNNRDKQDWKKEGNYYYLMYNGANYYGCVRFPGDNTSNDWGIGIVRSTNPLSGYDFNGVGKIIGSPRQDICTTSYPVINNVDGNLYMYYATNPLLARSKLVWNSPIPTATPVPPTSTPVPTATPTPIPTNTPTPTPTPSPTSVPPTATPVPPSPTPTGGPTPTPGQTSSMSLTLKIKLQGITKKPTKPSPITVQVKLAGERLTATTAYKSASFSVNDAGEWTGKVDFDNIPTGGGYKVFIKGPKHIQKKICEAIPKETSGGLYHCGDGTIVLQAGNNTFDFSQIIQMAGDLPEANGVQNGIVDAYDHTFIRTNLGSTDASKLAIGDLNLDGIIDTQDYSMILQSLSIKFDEE